MATVLNTQELDKETYRAIITGYFRAFETGDFSEVGFSSQIQFLSPISGITMKGLEDVTRFVTGVATRVVKVNILYISVDYPNASGVWQMTTTKGTLYTLHNYFTLDGEGLNYIWPMFDPKAVMDNPTGLLQWLRGEGYYDVVARSPKQHAGVAVSKTGRLFINYPRWIDEPTPSVGEVKPDGTIVAYPNEELNAWDKQPGESASKHFVCVQSVVVDNDDFLWILDPASPMFQAVVPGGAKLLKVNLATNQVERTYNFDDKTAPVKSYLNDVRFAHGHAFITDSGLGAIVVLNLSTGKVRRLLENHASTKAEAGVEPVIGGKPWKFADGTTPQVHTDGIAIDPKKEYVYYKALTGKTLYRAPISALVDETVAEQVLGNLVEKVAVTEATDGLEFDSQGNLYYTSLEWNAIKVMRPNGKIEVFSRSTDLLWPDSIAMTPDGHLVVTSAQFHLMPLFNDNEDKRTPPYKVFKFKLKQ